MLMKSKLLATVILLFAVFVSQAQTSSKGFKFQGFADTPEGEALKREAVTVKFTIYPKTGTGFVFVEEQQVVTDAYGIFYATVGEINPDDFLKINFTAKSADYWMKVEVKKTVAGVYTTISDNELAATPYARCAENGVPVGTIMPFAGALDKIPEGWLLCDGTEYDGSAPEYEQLYNVIGNTWGGSGTAFNVPALSGVFLRGLDNGTGNDPDAAKRVAIKTGANEGDKVGSYQTDETGKHKHHFNLTTDIAGNHTHNINVYSASNIGPASSGDKVINNADGGVTSTSTGAAGAHTHTVTGDTDDNTGVETRPINTYVAYIVKY